MIMSYFEETSLTYLRVCKENLQKAQGKQKVYYDSEQNSVHLMRETKFYYCSQSIVINYCYTDEGHLKKWNMFLKGLKPC